jgi:hexulose-6-phosphate isomerase
MLPSKLSRRSFLTTASFSLGALALGNQPSLRAESSATTPPKRPHLRKAMMYGTIGIPGTLLEKFRAIRAAGFEGVEPLSHMKQDDVRRALEETGLEAASVCCATHWKPESVLSSPDPEARARGVEGVRQALRDAKAYGAKSVLLVPGTVREGVTFEDCWQRSIAEIRKLVPTCEETGVRIAIENVWNNFILRPEQAKQYLEEIQSEWVGWHFDIGNMIRYGPSEEWISLLGKRILNLHIKEYSAKPNAEGKAPGFQVQLLEGDNHWPEIMSTLDATHYQGWAITEQPAAQTKDPASLAAFSQRLDRVLAS